MNRGILYEGSIEKPQFSGHETFPLRYGWLKKVYDAVKEAEQSDQYEKAKDVFLSDDAIARFGVGKNMVSSMRHWAASCNIIEDDQDITLTNLAHKILADDGYDPWLEKISSVWVCHWHIATSSSKATYIWLFNHYGNSQFDRPTITKKIKGLCDELGWKASESTIKRDVECLIRAYMNRSSAEGFSEDQIESPFAELGLMHTVNRNTFQLKRGKQPSLKDGVFLYALINFWKNYTSAQTLSLEAICYEPCSPGRVFCLDEDSVADRLYVIEKTSNGLISWTETAGIRQISVSKELKTIDAIDFLELDYQQTINLKAA